MGTESRNPRSRGLDKMSASEIVRLMNEEETAVQKALTFAESGLAQAIEQRAVIYIQCSADSEVVKMLQ